MPPTATIQPVWIVACTGHRPAHSPARSREALTRCGKEIERVLRELAARAETRGGRIEVLTSLAAGIDLLTADAAAALEIPVHAILPLPEPEFLKDFAQDDRERDRAQAHIDRARSGNCGGTLRIVSGEGTRPACYHETNQQLIECCDALLAVWDGEPPAGIGGTGEVVEEAARLGIPAAVIMPTADGPASVDLSHFSGWPAKPDVLDALNTAIADSGALPPVKPSERTGPGPAWEAFRKLDHAANTSSRHFRRRLILALVLHFVAALLAACTASFAPVFLYRAGKVLEGRASLLVEHLSSVLTGVEFALVLWAWWLMLQAHRRHSHEVWRRTRFAAEQAHGLILSAGLLDPVRPLIAHRQPAWRGFALAMGLNARRSTPERSLDEARDAYLTGRVRDQIDHFRLSLTPTAAWKRRLERLAWFATTFAPVVIGAALAIKLIRPELVKTTYAGGVAAALLPIAFPLCAGAAVSLMVALDAGRRAHRYGALAEHLARITDRLPGVRTPGALRRLVYETEETLLDELVEWHAASKNVGH